MVTILSALAGGCARVLVSDLSEVKLDIAKQLAPGKIFGFPVDQGEEVNEMQKLLQDHGADVVFECAGHHEAAVNAVRVSIYSLNHPPPFIFIILLLILLSHVINKNLSAYTFYV